MENINSIKRDNKGRFVKGGNAYLFNSIKKGQRVSPKTEFKKGSIPWSKLNKHLMKGWNKGLTKETDKRLGKASINQSEARQKGLENGTIKIWNKGLTTEDTRVKKNCEANQKWKDENIKGKTYEEIYGGEKAKEIKLRMGEIQSVIKKGDKNPMFGRTGELSPRWLGGKSFEPYDKNWTNKFKRRIRKRDNQICMMCGIHKEKYGRTFDVHHINYDKKISLPQNCISLCRKCHSLTQANRKHYTELFQSILSKNYDYQYSDNAMVLDLNKILKLN